jgi:hypothetical protein
MQKLINVVALLSGLTSLGLIGGSAYVLLQKDAIIEGVKEQTLGEVKTILPGLVKELLPPIPKPPALPKMTGGAIPLL